ncbi:hypothetical protein Hanom_Chr17g01570221 [Helianthus anomalus]
MDFSIKILHFSSINTCKMIRSTYRRCRKPFVNKSTTTVPPDLRLSLPTTAAGSRKMEAAACTYLLPLDLKTNTHR